MCTAGEQHAAAAAACCCLFCVTPGFPLSCTVYFELTFGMGLISMTFHQRAYYDSLMVVRRYGAASGVLCICQ